LSDISKRYILIGGGVGIPPMVFAADDLITRGGKPVVWVIRR